MSTQFSFHGGIHPPENKQRTTGLAIQTAPIPAELVVPLSQHIGAPSEVIVSVGDRVLKGQVIAEAVGRISVNVHAPSSGTVVAIEKRGVPHISGMKAPCIVIETDGQEQWVDHQGLDDYAAIPKQALIDFIRHHGISGMGGAGFPTDVKLHLGDDHIVNTLVLNAMECEPYITADDMLLREHADNVIKGIEVIAHLLKPHHVMIGIEDNKPQAIRALELAAKNTDLNLDIIVVPTIYPSGGEKQLIKLLTGVEVPSGKIPADVGIVCQNVGTAAAIYDAVYHGLPLISRIVTLAGEALTHPHNMRALIGTPLKTLLETAGVNQQALYRIVVGGPMMGFTVDSQSIPMIKTTNCIIAATYAEMPPAPPANPCIRCGMCEQVCPAELLPQQLYWFAKGKEFEKAKHHNLFDCIECGACSYVCPSNLPLVQYYRYAKAEIREEEAEHRKADHARQRFEARQARLEQEKIEKELRRKQRAEEAAKAQAVKKDKVATQPESTLEASAEPDIKTLKTAAAVARTKLKKAQKALQNAEEKGLEGQDKLAITVAELAKKAEAAQAAYDQAQNLPVAAPAVVDIKQLKTNAAVARTKLKQAEKALAKAEESGEGDIAELKAKLTAQQAKTEAAQSAYDKAEAGDAASSPSNAALDELKADMDAALDKVKKARKALEVAVAGNSPAVEKMQAGVDKLQSKYEALKADYEKANNQQTPEPAGPTVEQVAELKADADALHGKVAKAQAALDNAIASANPAADKMKAGVDKLQAKYLDAKARYDKAQASLSVTDNAPQLDALSEEITTLSSKVEKAKRALASAEASASPAAEKMKAGVEKLQAKLDELTQSYRDAGGVLAKPEPVDPKALKQQVSIMRTKLKKAQAALDDAEDDNLSELTAEVERLTTAHDEAKASLDAYESVQFDKAAAEGIDLKQLKIDAAMARAAVIKAERAAQKAREEQSDDLSDIEQQLIVAQQDAEQLNQTLSRFTD
jgi:electron transport complex protein RnfC